MCGNGMEAKASRTSGEGPYGFSLASSLMISFGSLPSFLDRTYDCRAAVRKHGRPTGQVMCRTTAEIGRSSS